MDYRKNQLTLPIEWKFSHSDENFVVSDCNRYAYETLEKWPFILRENFLCIVGEKGSGKTHLANIWANRVGAVFFNGPEGILDNWYSLSEGNNDQKFFVIDNADEIESDVFLFCIYNTIKAQNAYLLMTAKSYPNKWNVGLADVKSRLSTVSVVCIQKPNEYAMTAILEYMLKQRGLILNQQSINYLVLHLERSYVAVNLFVEKLDIYLRQTQAKPTLQTIKNILYP